jgi:serine/threonine protein kinase
MSPESLNYNKISKESDVWSYGVLLWEIFSYGCTPYASLSPEEILEKLKAGYRMDKPSECDAYIYENFILKCWHSDAKKRPSFTELVGAYEQLIGENQEFKR